MCVYVYVSVCVCVRARDGVCEYVCVCTWVYMCMYMCVHVCVRVCTYVCECACESVRVCHHHHHVVLVARISLTLSRHSSLSFITLGRSSGQHPVSSHNCWMYVRAGRPAFARPCVGVHKSTSLMSSSLLLQQCPACVCVSVCVCV